MLLVGNAIAANPGNHPAAFPAEPVERVPPMPQQRFLCLHRANGQERDDIHQLHRLHAVGAGEAKAGAERDKGAVPPTDKTGFRWVSHGKRFYPNDGRMQP